MIQMLIFLKVDSYSFMKIYVSSANSFKDIKFVEIFMGVSFSVSANAKPKIFPFRI